MSDKTADVILLTDDAELSEAVRRHRPESARLVCLRSDDVHPARTISAGQCWIDVDTVVPPPTICDRRVYFYSAPVKPGGLPAGTLLRKPCAPVVLDLLWASAVATATKQTLAPPAPAGNVDPAPRLELSPEEWAVPAWLLDYLDLDLRTLCHRLAADAPALLGCGQAALYLHDPQQRVLTLAQSNAAGRVPLTIPIDPAGVRQLCRAAEKPPSHRLEAEAPRRPPTGLRLPATFGSDTKNRAWPIPLADGDDLWGLFLAGAGEAPPAGPLATNRTLRRIFARCLRNARHHQRARIEARVDRLTGLFNDRWMAEALEKEIERCRRYHSPLALMMIDLDRLKEINDRFGHLAGDALIRHAAGRITAGLRQIDSAARVGGDEFVVLLPATDLDGARHVAERVHRNLRSDPPVIRGRVLRVSASIGVTAWRRGWNAERLLASADQAMYLAKRGGGSRIHCHRSAPRRTSPPAPDSRPRVLTQEPD